jgi:hypothetical protein
VHPGAEPSRLLVAPVTYIAEMNERNGPTLGFDVYSEPCAARPWTRHPAPPRPPAGRSSW